MSHTSLQSVMTTTPEGSPSAATVRSAARSMSNARFVGSLLLVVRTRAVELSVAQHDPALGEDGAFELGDRPGVGSVRQLPRDALRQDLRRAAALPRAAIRFSLPLGPDAGVQLGVRADLRCVIREIRQLVQHDVRLEGSTPG